MVKEIAHIHFAALTELVLGGNGIESVEGLARVRMAHIEEVSLCTDRGSIGNNNITSVEVMRKAAWPSLKTLIIGKEWIMQKTTTSEMPTVWCKAAFPDEKTFGVLKVGIQEPIHWAILPSQDTDCLPVILVYIISHVGILKNKFCFGRSLESVLQQRWPHIHIEWFLSKIYFILFISWVEYMIKPFCEVPIAHTIR